MKICRYEALLGVVKTPRGYVERKEGDVLRRGGLCRRGGRASLKGLRLAQDVRGGREESRATSTATSTPIHEQTPPNITPQPQPQTNSVRIALGTARTAAKIQKTQDALLRYIQSIVYR